MLVVSHGEMKFLSNAKYPFIIRVSAARAQCMTSRESSTTKSGLGFIFELMAVMVHLQ